MARGTFITLEGGEGAGKSTQAALLAETLRRAGKVVIVTREPGGSPAAEALRALLVKGEVARWDPLAETLLHYAARRQHLAETVIPALSGGHWVVSDRFADSTMAYQGYGLGVRRKVIERLYDIVVGVNGPDLTLILDLPAEVGLERAAAKGGAETRYERLDADFHRRLRTAFLDIARLNPTRCAVIDATGPIEAVQAAIRATVAARLGIALP